MMQEKRIVGALQAEQNAKAQAAKAELIAKNEDRAPIDIAKVNQIMQAQSNREKLIAKNEDRAPINEVKVQQLVQQSVEANRWAGVASVAQAMQEEESEKKNTGGVKGFAAPVPTYEPPNNFWLWLREGLNTWADDHIVQPVKTWTNNHIVQPVREWTEVKIEQTWPAIRATGPGENGINLVNKYRDVIIGTVSSFNSHIKANGSIPYTYEYTNGKENTIQKQQEHSASINPTSLAISMSVQAEAPGIIDFFQWVFRPLNSPSYGMAQIEPDKYELIKQNIQPYLNLDGISNNPYFALQNPQVSTAAMIERVTPSLEICQKYDCTPTDREIVIALSQNGPGFNAVRLEEIIKNARYKSDNQETIIDWQEYFNDQKPYPREKGVYRYYILNWRASGHNFDTWFMLNRYYNNAMVFENEGNWSMPQGVEWDYIESLIENTPPAQP